MQLCGLETRKGRGLLEGKWTRSVARQAQDATQNSSKELMNQRSLEVHSCDLTRMGARRQNGLYSWPWVVGTIPCSLASEHWIWRGGRVSVRSRCGGGDGVGNRHRC